MNWYRTSMKGDIPFLLIGGPVNYEVKKTAPDSKEIHICDPNGQYGQKDMMYVYIVKPGTDEAHYSHTEEARYWG